MYKSIIFITFISRSKKWNQKCKSCVWSLCSVNNCWDFDILLVSSLTICGSAGEKALKGHSIFLALNGPFLLGLTQKNIVKGFQNVTTETLHSQFPMCKLKNKWRVFPFYKARFYTFFPWFGPIIRIKLQYMQKVRPCTTIRIHIVYPSQVNQPGAIRDH